MPTLQKMVQTAKQVMPRGWSPIMRNLSKVYPPARMYPAALTNGDTLFVDLSENMCHLYFYYGSLPHEEYSHAFFRNFLNPGDVFIDVGANIGYFTRLASALVGPGGRVHAFEPLPSALRLLHENTRNLNNVRLHEIAASNVRGTSSFSVQSSGDTSSLGADPASREVIRVQTDTLDGVLADVSRVDLIKIDVEGYELEVLRGATQLIRSKQPLIYFEYIERYAAARGQSLESFRQVLAPLGYAMGWISHDYPAAPLISRAPSSYLIAAPVENRWGIDF